MLDDDEHVEQALKSLFEREWPPYESCYPEGLRLCRRVPFRRLLTEQLTAADLL
jgi:hypothetical protein